MTNVSLSLLVLKTPQVETVRKFYGSLGIEFTNERHGKGPLHYSGRLGEVVIEIYPLSEDSIAADSTTRLGFTIEDLDDVLEALKSSGADMVKDPQATEWGIRALVRDPDGRAVELYQR